MNAPSIQLPSKPAMFFPAVSVPRGAGEFLVKPGKPVTKITAVQLASVFAVDRHTIYRWMSEGLIAREFIERAGKRKLLFNAAVIEALQKQFAAIHEGEPVAPVATAPKPICPIPAQSVPWKGQSKQTKNQTKGTNGKRSIGRRG